MIDVFRQISAEFLIGYSTLFSIINPIGSAFVFLEMCHWVPDTEQRALATRIALYTMLVLIVSLIAGSWILRFFGITLPALRIAGGFAVAMAGWRMLNAPAKTVPREAMDRVPVMTLAFFPLTIPLTAGPGSISAAIALGAHRSSMGHGFLLGVVSSSLVALAIAVTVYLAYRHSATVARLIGPEGTRVVTRLSAFLLLCVGVQIMLTGVTIAIQSALDGAA